MTATKTNRGVRTEFITAVKESLRSLGYFHIATQSSSKKYVEADGGRSRMLVYLADRVEIESKDFQKTLAKLMKEAGKQNRDPWIAKYHDGVNLVEWLEPIDFKKP